MIHRYAVAGLLAVMATGTSCHKPDPGGVDPALPSFVEVRNQSFYDMNIYLIRTGTRIRLGTVAGNRSAVFEIPRTYVNPGLAVRFQADPVGSSRTPFSQEIGINPGERIVLTIPPNA